MGYYTHHELEIKGPDQDYDKHCAEISKQAGYGDCFEEPIKWYNHSFDMKQHSLRYPELTFILSGAGEENGDLWMEYFKNGKSFFTKAKITFDDYNESKLA